MKLLIVPKPVLTSILELESYCFRYQRGDDYLADQYAVRLFDGVINLPSLDVLEDVGLNGFTNGAPLFVPINHFTLLSDVTLQCTQPADKIIFLLGDEVPAESIFTDCIKKLRKSGYRFAVENIKDYSAKQSIVELCDFIFISFRLNNKKVMEEYRGIMRQYPKHTFIASDVNDINVFNSIRSGGFAFFEGRFYKVPVNKGHNTIAPVKVNRIQLMNIVREPDFSIEEVVKVVSQDTSLSISLLKLVNSPYMGLSQKVKSIQHAVAMLGQTEVRKWVTTATSGLLADDKPDELTRLSLVRAKFSENLSRHFEMAIHAPALFLMGLFSILDIVLEMSMAEAFKIISVTENIYDALVFGEGDFAKVIHFVKAYEAADWSEVNRLMTLHKLNVEDVFHAYMDTVRWYSSITKPEAAEAEETEN
ncbi:MAG: HDOD domain-containing protein [Defluviitaleaceae bacterium]|nr:HDOD domain-containing protein [Defluviitaleaceae bacterium]